MKKLWVVFAIAIMFSTASCGGGSTSSSEGSAVLYNNVKYSSGSGLTAVLSFSDISLSAFTGNWSSESSTKECDGSYNGSVTIDGQGAGSFSGLVLPCKKRTKYVLGYANGALTLSSSTEDL